MSLEIHKATLTFPKIEQFVIANQMRRASKSICANLAEGFARQASSPVEFRRYVQMAAGSAAEMSVWVEYVQALEYITQEQATKWFDRYDHISRMLQNLRTNIETSNPRVFESKSNIESSNDRVLEFSEAL